MSAPTLKENDQKCIWHPKERAACCLKCYFHNIAAMQAAKAVVREGSDK